MTVLDLDALEATARAAIINDDPEDWPLAGAVGWDDAESNELVAALTPGTVLALITRLWEAEAVIAEALAILEGHLGLDSAVDAARALSEYKPTPCKPGEQT